MKVSTEACLLGALVEENNSIKTVLDIGSGTGLLTLMMAQKFQQSKITAVEIEESAFQQMKENFFNNIWSDRIEAYFGSIQKFVKENSAKKFDLIISNPPFFENDLLTNDFKSNIAKHSTELTLKELLACAFHLLNENGALYLLLPFHRKNEIISHCSKIIFLKDNPKSFIKRCVYVLQKNDLPILKEETLILKNEHGFYSNDFKNLMQPFYFKL